ncbi:MAG: PadR family transcriptional regulator [Candidatus Helarchaeota archaeon]
MIKRVKEFHPSALIIQKRSFLENFESEILRGISTLTVLAIINEYSEEGTYGYQILKNLEEKTGAMLIIEDGTLYPILKKLQREGIITSEKKVVGGRQRTYYKLTIEGLKIYKHMEGFFTKLIESIAPLLDIEVSIRRDRYLYCPNCTNRIDLRDPSIRFCEVCGLNIEDLKRRP